MRVFYLSLFLMVFFLIISLFQNVPAFALALEGGNSPLTEDADKSTDEQAKEDIGEMKNRSSDKLRELSEDPGLVDYFSLVLYGISVFLQIILSTLKYILWFAPLLMKWGVPFPIAGFLQTIIYILYALSIKDLFFARRLNTR